jgi:hypothetical protein
MKEHRHEMMMLRQGGCGQDWENEMMESGNQKRIIIRKFGGDEMDCNGHCEKQGDSRKGGEQEKVEIRKDTVIIKK